jgi:hypothetical protein
LPPRPDGNGGTDRYFFFFFLSFLSFFDFLDFFAMLNHLRTRLTLPANSMFSLVT